MPQVVEFPPLGQEQRTLLALVKLCKETPAKGEPFREFRTRMRSAKLWDRDRPEILLRFLGTGGAIVHPSPFMQALGAANTEDEIAVALLDRLWHLNPLLMKTVLDLVATRTYHKDEVAKHLVSLAYKGVQPSRPMLEVWIQMALSSGLLRTVGIAVASGTRAERYVALANGFDPDEFLAEDKPEPEPVVPRAGDEDATSSAVPDSAAPDASIPNTATAPVGSPLPGPLRQLSAEGLPLPRGRERPVPTSRFAHEFSDEVLTETQKRIEDWWNESKRDLPAYAPSDFALDAEQWVEAADEVVYRVAVAAALAFRLDRDRNAVIAAYTSLEQHGVLADLFQGNVPESLPVQVDARALMLASLAARRCAEVPELASQLEGRASAAEAFATLDSALGRGLFRTELFWILDMLGQLGVIRYDDLAEYSVTPHRIVRDTLFRLGFIATPYGSTPAPLTAASRAARKAVPTGPAAEILTLFALAAGCAYDCPHRKVCDYPCRERLE